MTVRQGNLLASGLLALLTAAILAGPAAADVITVCGGPAPQMTVPTISNQLAQVLSSVEKETDQSTPLALTRDEKGHYDLIANWQSPAAVSLRSTGASISGLELGGEIFHLIVSRGDQHPEHFLFSLDEAGTGELLWSSEGAAPHRSGCLKPE
jgi:hypothetical protein